MLSKRSLFKYSLLYNIVAVVLNLVVDLCTSTDTGTTSTVSLRPIESDSFWIREISNRLLHSSGRTRPTLLLHSKRENEFILEGNYGTRNIAWPWMVHYAKDYVKHFAYFKDLTPDLQLFIAGYLLNLISGMLQYNLFIINYYV